MTVTLTDSKVDSLICKCKANLLPTTVKIRKVAELIGILVSSFTAVQFGPLHYRAIDYDKVRALRTHHGDFDQTMFIRGSDGRNPMVDRHHRCFRKGVGGSIYRFDL